MKIVRFALVGMGKIAADQHLPAVARHKGFELVATVSPQGVGVAGVPHFETLEHAIAGSRAIDAVAICTPPQARFKLAQFALEHGLHVLLEKPPSTTVGEVECLIEKARSRSLTLFAAWHSRFAPCVEPARVWLAPRRIEHVSVAWLEDVRTWHPFQEWIWQSGGLGVFDSGINALSILTQIYPRRIYLRHASLDIPSNRAAPIAARLFCSDAESTVIEMNFDWRHKGHASWTITVATDAGVLELSQGGASMSTPTGERQMVGQEYPCLYAHFHDMIQNRLSDVDLKPLQLVADAFICGSLEEVEGFHD